MNEPMFTLVEVRRRARQAANEGKKIADCPFDPHSGAFDVWRAEFKRVSPSIDVVEASET